MCETGGHNCKNKLNYPERRWIQFLILRVVCQEPLHGYGIVKAIEELSEGRHIIKSGTMYTTLRRMEKEGLLESFWERSDTGPDKRMYKVTRDGRKHLKEWLEMLMERKRMMEKILLFYEQEFRGDNREDI
ncbi:PadR family transcriptional regulator [Methanohalophilus mahii]|uniref:Transcriptional regulator, PadR-like family n=1 Tax=Methanohalophilus mahii (strain ATCC 35705 / DSM 5219 / SLP) TaxID=547558 RepID=D5E6K6_METMS|nr:helix-turn-helix transcriptional regulator [Methanohalophilus mahii]ADE36794.1 transcriptional regulator, PadR-like family [Methanohalophilus mahii DSM 5219]